MQGVAGRVAVVTGAGQGNGRAVALGLARAGAHVALCDVDRERLEETTADVAAEGGRVFSAFADVSDREACRTFAAGCREELGEAEILVNNAGIIRRQRLNSDEFDQGWDDIFRVNVDGTRNMVRAFLPQLRARKGRIVNLGLPHGRHGRPLDRGLRSSSKGAILQFTKALASELAPDGIRVNAIAPGVIATPMTEATRGNEAAIGRFLSHTPLGRVGDPEELVGPVLFLASDMSTYVTGALLPVDGGYLAA